MQDFLTDMRWFLHLTYSYYTPVSIASNMIEVISYYCEHYRLIQ